jgi:alpha-beta hydrolase superfamily lysophospholipase
MLLFLLPLFAWANNCPVDFAKVVPKVSAVSVGGRTVAYQYSPVKNPKGTVLLLNGLMIRMKDWQSYAKKLRAEGYSVLQVAYSGQPESIAKNSAPQFAEPISGAMLAEEIQAVITKAKIDPPLHIHAYSYGSFPGMEYAKRHPDQVASVTLLNAMAKSLDNYIPQAAMANATLEQMRSVSALMDPFGLFGGARQIANFQENAYRKSVRDSLAKYKAGEHFPARVVRRDFEDGIVELTMGAKDFDLADYAGVKLPKIHLLLAKEEFYPEMRADQLAFFRALKKTSKGKLHVFDQYEHNDLLGAAEDDFLQVATPLLNNTR